MPSTELFKLKLILVQFGEILRVFMSHFYTILDCVGGGELVTHQPDTPCDTYGPILLYWKDCLKKEVKQIFLNVKWIYSL